ncbi:MAG: hypothetical protein R6U02_03295 [Alkalibacterium sp.]|uniref:hypothetical protein n=1 Tax=Alkalibacterium sp. TaxID=1872447 RepID=UPI0039707489
MDIKGNRFAALVSELGATPLMEQFIFMNDARRLLEDEQKLNLVFKKADDYLTVIEIAEVSLFIENHRR